MKGALRSRATRLFTRNFPRGLGDAMIVATGLDGKASPLDGRFPAKGVLDRHLCLSAMDRGEPPR